MQPQPRLADTHPTPPHACQALGPAAEPSGPESCAHWPCGGQGLGPPSGGQQARLGVTHGDSTGHRQDPRPQAPRLRACPTGLPRRRGRQPRPGAPNAAHQGGLGLSRWSQGQGGVWPDRPPIILPTGPHCSPLPGGWDPVLPSEETGARDSLCVTPLPPEKPSAQPSGRAWGQRDHTVVTSCPAVQCRGQGAGAGKTHPVPGGKLRSEDPLPPTSGPRASSVTQKLQAKQGPRPLPPWVQPRPESHPAHSAAAQAGGAPGVSPCVGRTRPLRGAGAPTEVLPRLPRSPGPRPLPDLPSPRAPQTQSPASRIRAPGKVGSGAGDGKSQGHRWGCLREPRQFRQETSRGVTSPGSTLGSGGCSHRALTPLPGRPGGQRASVPNHKNGPKREDPGSYGPVTQHPHWTRGHS